MAKDFKKFDVTKKYTTRNVVDEQTGEEKIVPVSYRIGSITLFSESQLPDDISIRLEMPEHYLMGDNQLNVWPKRD